MHVYGSVVELSLILCTCELLIHTKLHTESGKDPGAGHTVSGWGKGSWAGHRVRGRGTGSGGEGRVVKCMIPSNTKMPQIYKTCMAQMASDCTILQGA